MALSTYIAESSRDVKNPKFRKAMALAGLEKVILCKGDGYFWITSDDDEMSDKINSLRDTTIYLNAFNQQYIDDWVDDIKRLLEQE